MAKDSNTTAIEGQPADSQDWQRFVAVHGVGALNRDLAHVVGRTVAEIAKAKSQLAGVSGAGGRSTGKDKRSSPRHEAKGFDALFQAWHGRPPLDSEWRQPVFLDVHGSYEWLQSEIGLVATLVGQMSPQEIAGVLTERLRQITGDPLARRDRMAVQNRIARLGLVTSDVLGGLTVAAAGREVGSYTLVHQAIRNGALVARYVGRYLVIPHAAWREWKGRVQATPEGFTQLSTLRVPLGLVSDKLSEMAKLGYVPGAVQVKPYGVKNLRTTRYGTWYVPDEVAARMLSDRHAGRPMPWHGKPLLDNLKATHRTWQLRQHPTECATCALIWGAADAPQDFSEFVARYPALDHGAKRHLTRVWTPGLTVAEVAVNSGRSEQFVRRAIANGMMAPSNAGSAIHVSRTDATRWIARHCPGGEGSTSWISLDTAVKQYLFTSLELEGQIASNNLVCKVGTEGAARGIRYVSRHQCAQLRDQVGFTHEQAAARAKVSVEQLRELLVGVDWRAAPGIPLSTLQAVIKRIQSRRGMPVEQAASALGASSEWISECIADGVIKVKRNDWSDRVYITDPMLERLRAVQTAGRREKVPLGWVRLSEAAGEAGVSTTTLLRWAEAGGVQRVDEASGWHFDLASVRAQARVFWATTRAKRARPPAWLRVEGQSAQGPGQAPQAPQASAHPVVAAKACYLWSGCSRIALAPLIALRQSTRAAAGLRPEPRRQIDALFAQRYARIKDMELVALSDVDEVLGRELSMLASEFAGTRVELKATPLPAVAAPGSASLSFLSRHANSADSKSRYDHVHVPQFAQNQSHGRPR